MRYLLFIVPLSILNLSMAKATECVQVSVESSALCQKLKVKFDTSQCDVESRVLSTKVTCRNEFVADVIGKTLDNDYSVVITKNANGTWTPGEVQKTKLDKGEAEIKSSQAAGLAESSLRAGSFTVTGQFRFRAEMLDRTDFVNTRSPTLLRVRPKVTWDPNPKVSVVFEPQGYKGFGEDAYVGNGASSSVRTDTSGTSTDTSLSFHSAFGEYQALSDLKFRVGRMPLSYGDEIIVGSNETSVAGRSFDAALVKWEGQSGWADLFTSKLSDRSVSTQNAGDKDLHGLYTQWHLGDLARDLDLYSFYYLDSTGSGSNNTKVIMYGARIASDISIYDYRIEYTKDTVDYDGYQLDLDLGVKPETWWNPRLSVGYFEAGANYFEMFPTTGIWLGFADVVARRNLKGGRARIDFSPTEAWPVALSYYLFTRNDGTQPAYKDDGSTALGTANGSTSKDIGSELNVVAQYKLDPAITIKASLAKFFSGAYIKDQIPGVDPVRYFVQTDIRF